MKESQVYARVDTATKQRLKHALARRLDLTQPGALKEALLQWLEREEGGVSSPSLAGTTVPDDFPEARQPVLDLSARLLAVCDEEDAQTIGRVLQAMMESVEKRHR